MTPHVEISDVAIWLKHIQSTDLRDRLRNMPDDSAVTLEVDGVIGNWIKMRTGKDGRPTDAIRPYGAMKDTWSSWYRHRKGTAVPIREVALEDGYLKIAATLSSEWDSPEDEEAFRDL